MWVIVSLIALFMALFFGMLAVKICWALLKWIIKLLYRFFVWFRHRNE